MKPTYPVHLQKDPNETDGTEANDTIYENHFFNFKNSRKSGRTCWSDISWHTAPLRGAPSVWIHHCTDESKVPAYYWYVYASVTSYQVIFVKKYFLFKKWT